MIKIELSRLNDAFHFEAKNEEGNTVHIDAAPDIGGTNQGMRPMQLLLASLGGCSVIDVVNILRKQRQDLKDIKVVLTGEREQGKVPSVYREINVHFEIYGNVDPQLAERAIDLTFEKYCSVSRIIEQTARITHSFDIIN